MHYRLELNSPVIDRFIGETLIDSISRRFTYHNRDFWLEKILSKEVLVDGLGSEPDHMLQAGQTVQFAIDDFYEPDLNTDYKVIWENEFLLLVNKPADLPVHSNRRFYYQTLTACLRRDYKIPKLNPIHRLDRETSGLILFQKKPFIQKTLRRNPRQLIGRKLYLTMIDGEFPYDELIVDKPLSEAGCPPVYYKMLVSEDGKPSQTIFYLISISDNRSLLLAELKSGRKHQIRAHLASIGYPVVGDKLYSRDSYYFLKRCNDNLKEEDLEEMGARHHLLHACAMTLHWPDTPDQTCFSEYMSDSWLKRLGSFKDWQQKIQKLYQELSLP